jgi:alanine racemase
MFCYDVEMKFIGQPLRTWIEIDTKAIAHNYRLFRKFIGSTVQFMGVVKSNAYGHNLIEFSRELETLGVNWLGVDSITEALALRKEKIKKPILVLGHTLPELYGEAMMHDISITISSLSQLRHALTLSATNKKKLNVHIKIDTGMHRQGFQLEEQKEVLRLLESPASKLVTEGLYTHLAEAKNPRSGDSTRRQLKEFDEWIKVFHVAGIKPIVHAAATGGTLLYPRAHFDMVRIGIGSYGLWPSEDTERFLSSKINLKPVLAWRARVGEVKEVKKGARVGYDFTEMLTRNSTLAVIPVGYWHGFPRLLSGRGRVLIHGKSARVVGRVSMDMIVVDVTDIPKVKMGDIATLIGKDRSEAITAGEIAKFAATTHYEIVTRLNPLMKKFYL